MKQVLRKGFSEVVVEDIPAPSLRKGSVLVTPLYSLISSGTESADLHTEGIVHEILERPSQLRALTAVAAAYGVLPTIRETMGKFQDRAVIGYSGAGAIIEKDPNITDLESGDMVAYGGQGSGHGEIVCVPRNLVVPLPADMSCREGTFATLGAIALNATRAASIEIGDSVAVIGLGLVGQLVAQLVNTAGGRAIGLDLSDSRVNLGLRLGLASGIVAGDDTEVDYINELTGGVGVDCAIVCAKSKSSKAIEQAVQMVRDRGRLVIVGAVSLNFPWGPMYAKEIQVRMARAYGPGSYDSEYELEGHDYPIGYVRWTENRNMEEFLRLVAEKRIAVMPLVTHEYPLDRAAEAYHQIIAEPDRTLAVLLQYQTAESRVPHKESRTITLQPPASPRNGTIGVALVGASNIARWAHIPNIRANPATYIHSVCATRGAAAKTYALRFGAAVATTDIQQVLADEKVGLIVVTNRHSRHASIAVEGLLAGKHVFVEKPMAVTEEDCRKVLEAERKSGCLLCVGFNRRYSSIYRAMKESLGSRPGPVLINIMMNASWVGSHTWIHSAEEGGGAILAECVHFLDLLCWLTGEEPIGINAVCLGTHLPEVTARNNVAITLELSGGSVGSINYTTHGHARGVQERVEIRTSGRTIVAEDMKRLNVQGKLFARRYRFIPNRGYKELFDDFIKSILTGSPSPVGASDGARATIVGLRAIESMQRRQRITITRELYTLGQGSS